MIWSNVEFVGRGKTSTSNRGTPTLIECSEKINPDLKCNESLEIRSFSGPYLARQPIFLDRDQKMRKIVSMKIEGYQSVFR